MTTLSLSSVLIYSPLIAMWGALLVHWFFPVPSHADPVNALRYIAEAIAEKVNHANDSSKQQRLSGSLALTTILLTASVALLALEQLIWITGLFDFLLLWLALRWKPLTQVTQQIEHALCREDKPTARTLLAINLNRDTLALSPIGIAKAGCETLLVGYARGLIGVLFWYAIGGGTTAFLYTLTVQLTRQWSPRIQEFSQFGLSASATLTVIDWLPSRLFALLIATGHRCKAAVIAIFQQGEYWSPRGTGWLLASCGAKFQLSLGGPAIYNNNKIVRVKIGGEIAPSPLHMALLNQQLKQKGLWWILLQSVLMLLALSAI